VFEDSLGAMGWNGNDDEAVVKIEANGDAYGLLVTKTGLDDAVIFRKTNVTSSTSTLRVEGDLSGGTPTLQVNALNNLVAADFNGSISINDGTQAAGAVLTSDAGGNASWVLPSTTAILDVTGTGTVWTHPLLGTTTVTWDATTKILTFNNGSGGFMDVTMSNSEDIDYSGQTVHQSFSRDVGNGGTLTIDGDDQTSGYARGFTIHGVTETGTHHGFLLQLSGYGNTLRGTVTYY
jgi:hypothetical protein